MRAKWLLLAVAGSLQSSEPAEGSGRHAQNHRVEDGRRCLYHELWGRRPWPAPRSRGRLAAPSPVRRDEGPTEREGRAEVTALRVLPRGSILQNPCPSQCSSPATLPWVPQPGCGCARQEQQHCSAGVSASRAQVRRRTAALLSWRSSRS